MLIYNCPHFVIVASRLAQGLGDGFMRKKRNFNFLYVLILALFITMIYQKPAYASQIGTTKEMSAKVYEKKNEDSTVVANVINGSIFTILAEEVDADGIEWCLVQTDLGIKGYIKKEYVKEEVKDENEENEIEKKWQIEFKQNVNIRLQPTTEAEIVGRVPQYTILEPLQTQENDLGEVWYQIVYEGVTGFVRESAVDIIEIEDTVEISEEVIQEIETKAAELETEMNTETEIKITGEEGQKEETENRVIQETEKQEKKSQKTVEAVQKVTTRKMANPIDCVVIVLVIGIVTSAFMAVMVLKLMRKEQRKKADKNKNSRRKGK